MFFCTVQIRCWNLFLLHYLAFQGVVLIPNMAWPTTIRLYVCVCVYEQSGQRDDKVFHTKKGWSPKMNSIRLAHFEPPQPYRLKYSDWRVHGTVPTNWCLLTLYLCFKMFPHLLLLLHHSFPARFYSIAGGVVFCSCDLAPIHRREDFERVVLVVHFRNSLVLHACFKRYPYVPTSNPKKPFLHLGGIFWSGNVPQNQNPELRSGENSKHMGFFLMFSGLRRFFKKTCITVTYTNIFFEVVRCIGTLGIQSPSENGNGT